MIIHLNASNMYWEKTSKSQQKIRKRRLSLNSEILRRSMKKSLKLKKLPTSKLIGSKSRKRSERKTKLRPTVKLALKKKTKVT